MSEPTGASVRADVRAWLEANWSPDRGLIEWRNMLIDSGWGVPSWPKDWYGRELPVALERVVDEELKRIGAVGVAKTGIRRLAAATLLVHGNDAQKEKFLRRSLTGEDTWCQLFSEPGSGSDLAGATTRAEFRGNRWVINGQKVWTTSAHHADWGLLLARTDVNVPKHQGLSYFILDIRQPGVEVHPLRQMNGHASFNQVFFTDAEVPPEMLVSEVGRGWAVATTTLMHERRGADGIRTWGQASDSAGRIYDEERAEIATVMEPYKWYPQRAGRVDLVVERAKTTGRASDPVVRQEIAKAADNVESGGMDSAARPGGAGTGSAAGAGRLFGEAGVEPCGAGGGAGAHADQRGGCDADRGGWGDGRVDRRDPGVGAGGVDRRGDG
jgi:alkylation response protein AidB-like acyl-CoA dehydrogenase